MTDKTALRAITDVGVPSGVPAPLARSRSLRPKQERFAQLFVALGNATRAYRQAFHCRRMKSSTATQRGYQLRHVPAVAARIRELLDMAAEGTTISARSRMAYLQEVVEADPSEILKVVRVACGSCWDAEARAANPDADTTLPREDCQGCRGDGVAHVRVAPSDDWSPAARKLVRSIREKNGEIEIRFADQLAAADMLNRMQGVYVDKTVTVTARVDVPRLDRLSREEQLEFLNSLRPVSE